MTKKKEVCGTCALFNREKKNCRVAILHEGEEYHIPVDEDDKCFFQDKHLPETEIKQVRFWVEDPKSGEKSEEGIVKMEYPEGFFGKEEFPENFFEKE